ncbi:MAG TPA: hypothetical protein VNO76_00490 [Thermoplasmata archaeon]|nr:hypothetical protein [Thermoplasmata archaeon]
MYASLSGMAATNGVKSSNPYSHYSLLKLIETVWGGGSLGPRRGGPEPDRVLAMSNGYP